MTDSYTGPLGIPKEIWEAWYHRMKDMFHTVQQRGLGIAVHPDDAAPIRDMLERLVEDETWPHGTDVPPLIESRLMQRGQVQPCNAQKGTIMTLREAVQSDTGMGRYSGLLLPRKGRQLPRWDGKGDSKRE